MLHGSHNAHFFFHLPKDHTCHPATQTWQWRWKSMNHWCLVKHLPWARCQEPDASGWNVHPQISLCRWNCHRWHYDVWSNHPGTWVLEYFREGRNPYFQILSLYCSEHDVLCWLWNIVYPDTEEHGGGFTMTASKVMTGNGGIRKAPKIKYHK